MVAAFIGIMVCPSAQVHKQGRTNKLEQYAEQRERKNEHQQVDHYCRSNKQERKKLVTALQPFFNIGVPDHVFAETAGKSIEQVKTGGEQQRIEYTGYPDPFPGTVLAYKPMCPYVGTYRYDDLFEQGVDFERLI